MPLPWICILLVLHVPASPPAALSLAWKDNWLTIDGPALAGKPLQIHYLEAYCRADSTSADWVKHTLIGHTTTLIHRSGDGRLLKLQCRLNDGVTVDHEIRAEPDGVDFKLQAHNPTAQRSVAHWAQPCVRLGEFTGADPKKPGDEETYLRKSFIFINGKLSRLPTTPWATRARYQPGQVWGAPQVPLADLNPRPLSTIVPSHGLIGCFNAAQDMIFATAWEPYQELFQGVARCLHSDFRLGGLAPDQSLSIRGKIYLLANDVPALLRRYERDFPEHQRQK